MTIGRDYIQTVPTQAAKREHDDLQNCKTLLRDEAYQRRLRTDTRIAALYTNESLSPSNQEMYNVMIEAKRNKRIYTVFTKRCSVFYKGTYESRGNHGHQSSEVYHHRLHLPPWA